MNSKPMILLGAIIGTLSFLGLYYFIIRKENSIQLLNIKEKAILVYTKMLKNEYITIEKYDDDSSKRERINCINTNNTVKYKQLVLNLINTHLSKVYQELNNILREYKIKQEEYNSIVDGINIVQCEEKLFKNYHPNINKKIEDDFNRQPEKIKQLIAELSKEIEEEIKGYAKKSIEEQNFLRFILKQKKDDVLYSKHQITLIQLKYLAYVNKMYSNEEICSCLQNLN